MRDLQKKSEYNKQYRLKNLGRIQEQRRVRDKASPYYGKWDKERKAKLKAYTKARREKLKDDPEYKVQRRHYEMIRAYNLSHEEYDALLVKQNYMCAICSKKHEETQYGRLAVDHCHETGIIRGLLCRRCNHGLGNFKDNLASLYNAITYLRRSMS